MRNAALAVTVAFGILITGPALAQQSATPSQPQVKSGQQKQEEADKNIKTRNSGQSGVVGEQETQGASAHPPGQAPSAGTQTTTGANSGASGPGSMSKSPDE